MLTSIFLIFAVFNMISYFYDITNHWNDIIDNLNGLLENLLTIFWFMFCYTFSGGKKYRLLNIVTMIYTAVYIVIFIVTTIMLITSPAYFSRHSMIITIIYFATDITYTVLLVVGIIFYVPKAKKDRLLFVHSLVVSVALVYFEYMYYCWYFIDFKIASQKIMRYCPYEVSDLLWVFVNIMSVALVYKLGFSSAYRNDEGDIITDAKMSALKTAYSLSSREVEILELIIRGKNNSDIASALFISENTVKVHIYHLYKKLQIKSRMEAINIVRNIKI